MDKIIKKLQEAGDIHSKNCCKNSQFGCDTDVTDLDCCDNIVFIVGLIKDTIEHLSYDMEFENEEQRKTAVKIYIESLNKA